MLFIFDNQLKNFHFSIFICQTKTEPVKVFIPMLFVYFEDGESALFKLNSKYFFASSIMVFGYIHFGFVLLGFSNLF
jgi:hypothetical protein